MEVKDLLKKASAGELQCTKCGATNVSLNNVRVGMKDGAPFIDPSAYGLCKKCDTRISLDRLFKQTDLQPKKWWKFWK